MEYYESEITVWRLIMWRQNKLGQSINPYIIELYNGEVEERENQF